ncbi:ROK family transcriptional regulator [Alphaproteobacteria bacterium]|jgi:predicted NBD/HSP70 family sugar kinase|nr:ROK family transcriptional regulator [Alphaproteobacteria bacterium]
MYKTPPSFEGVRQINRGKVLTLIHESPGIDRTEIAGLVGITNAAITNIVNELIRSRLVEEGPSSVIALTRGRKRVGLWINKHGGYVLGVSVLATHASVTLSNLLGTVIDEVSFYPKSPADPFNTLDEVAYHAAKLCKLHKVKRSRLLGVGFAIAGFLNKTSQSLQSAPYLGWPKFDLREEFQRRFKCPLVIENVTRCIASAETRIGSFIGAKNLVLVRAALGVGGAIISDGELLTGNRYLAGDLGHLLAERDGVLCSCGKRGCLNTVASGWSIIHKLGMGDSGYENIKQFRSLDKLLRDIINDCNEEDSQTADLVRNAGALLGTHLVNVLQVLDTEFCVLTGPLGRNRIYVEAFRNQLIEVGYQGKVVCSEDTNVLSPAAASVGLALSNLVFSASLNVDALMDESLNHSIAARR